MHDLDKKLFTFLTFVYLLIYYYLTRTVSTKYAVTFSEFAKYTSPKM